MGWDMVRPWVPLSPTHHLFGIGNIPQGKCGKGQGGARKDILPSLQSTKVLLMLIMT